ncbi:MAG: DUF11 domain-containing protein [Myxococcales bacterium]|nr:DUF11 domain-containing protein [Myxococcales bacterium]
MTPSPRTLARGLAAALLLAPCLGQALVDGEPHRLYAEHRVFGGAVVTGNTLMTASIANPAVNSGLLPRSSGDVNALPFDARVVGAYLFWSGSLDGRVDRNATLTVADGTSFDVAADRCVTVPSLGGFFYCRADVTDRVAPRPGPQAYNGRYTVGDVQAQPGFLDANGDCIDERECQAKYAGWSLVLVYSAPSAPTLRDIFVHDGFRQLDETPESPGIDQFRIEGFDFPRDGQAQLTFFALEGDSFLGVPPQDTDPVFPCATCFDFMDFNGRRLTNALNPPNNLFNSSSPGGFTLGLDIDTFDVSNFLRVGDTSAPIRVGSGDGIVNPGGGDPAGAGESFFLGYVLLSVDRNAPNFQKDGTTLAVIPDEAAPRERVVIRLQLDNEGTLDSLATRVQLSLPPGLTYLPGSLRVDGADPIPGDEAQNPLEPPGLPLGNIPFQGDTTREITFRAAIDPGVPAGTRLVMQGAITASNLPDEALTEEAVLVILGGLDLGQPTKRVIETSGDGRFTPGEVIRYDITIPNPNLRDVLGVDLVDDLPPYLDLLQVITFSGEDRSDPSQNRVEIGDIVVPASPGGGTTVTIIARIHDVEQLLEDGVPAGGLNGFAVANQAIVSAAGTDYPTDDPGTAAPNDPTRFSLSAAIDIGGAQTRKTGADVNGGRLEPGDRVRYTIQVQNTGTAPAEVFVNDPLPARTSDCQLESDHPDIVCAGGRLQGLIDVGPGEGERIVFSVQVAADAPNGATVQNVAMVRADAQQIELRSEALQVFAAPDLSASTKQVDAPGGVAVPGQRLTWQIEVTNRGNRPATAVVIEDPLAFDFAEVVPLDGGAYDAAARTITWDVGDLAPGATFLARFEGLLPAQLEDGTVVANQAAVVSVETGRVPTDDPRTPQVDDATRVTVRSQPLLVLTKALDTATASPGDTVTYTFRVRNTGTDAAPASRLVDVVPDGFFAAFEPSAGSVVNRRLDAPIPPLDVGAEATVTLRATLRDVLPDGAVVSNQAAAVLEVGGDPASDDPGTPAIDDPTRLTIESTPALALDKSVRDLNGGDVQPGDRLRYTLTVRATGDAPVFDARVTDPVPDGLEDVAVEGKGALGGGVIEWVLPAAVVPGTPVTLAFEATVGADVASGTVIPNQAMVAARDVVAVPSDDPTTPVAADPTVVTVISRPDLGRPAKTVEPREVRPGEQVTFRLEVRNQGTAPSGPVTVVDPLPAGLLDWQAEPPAMLSDVEARWAVPPLAPGEGVTLTLRATVPTPLADGTTFSNQATAQIEGLEAVPTDDPTLPGDADPTVVTVRSSPALTLFKTVQDLDGPPTRPGDTLRYTVVVLNDGDDVARQVVLRDPIVDDLTVTDSGDAAQMGDDLVWQLGDLAPGAPVERSFEAQVARGLPNGTLVGNQALGLAANAPDEVPSDDPATADPRDATRVRVVSAADLSEATKRVEPLDEGGFRPGNRVRYSIRVRNIGDDVARDVVLTDALPAALVDPVPSDGGVVADGVVTWRVDALRPSEVLTRTVEATLRVGLADGDIVRNQAQVIARDIAEPFLTDDPSTPAFDATAFVVVAEARLALTKAAEGLEPPRPGGELTWILTVTNEGDGASAPTEVVDPLPDGVEAPEAEAPAIIEGRTVRWPVPAVVPGGPPATLRVRVRVPEGTPDGTRISNQARLGDQLSDDPSTPLPADPTVVVVEDRPDLRGSVKGVAGDFEPGGAVLYTFEVVNRGSRAADAVQVIDAFPAALTEIVVRGADGVLDGRTLTVQLGSLEPGERRRFEVAARVVDDVEDGQVVANQAQVVAAGLEPALTDDPTTAEVADATTFVVSSRAVLLLTKTVRDDDGGSFEPGDPVSYVLRIENTGNRPARGVEVIDPIDDALTNLVVDGGELQDRTASWRVDALPAGDAIELQVRGRLRMDVADGREVTNQFGARVGAAGPFQLSDEVRFVVGAGGLVTTKTVRALGAAGFVPGGDVEYALTVMNEGVTDLDSVFVVDPVDLRAFARVEALDGGVFDPGRAVVEWAPAAVPALRIVPAGRSVRLRFRATLAPNLRAGEVVRNQAQVSVRDQAPVPSDDPETDAPLDPTSFVVGGGAGYTLIKRVAPGDGGFAPGSEITYTLVAENIGSSDGEGVALVDRLPPELIYVPGSTTLNGARVPDVGRQSPLELGLALRTPGGEPAVLPPGRPVEVQVRATIAEGAARGQVIANQGTLSDLTGVRVPSDDPTTPVAADPTTFVVDGAADLGSFVKSWRVIGRANAAEARIGETVEWALQVTNRGIAPGEAVRVSDPLPAGVRYVDGSLQLDGRGLSDAPDGDRGQVVNGQVTVDVGVVGPGTVSEVRFRTVVLRGPEVRNQGTLTAQGVRARLSDDDGVEANGLNPTVVPVGDEPLRRLTLAKRVIDADGAPTLAGESLTWVLTVGNAGNTEATDVEVSDPLPTGLVYVGPGDVPRGVQVDYEPPPAGDFQNGRVRITGLTIPAGEDVTVSFVARVDPRLDADRRICNGAQALAPDTPPVDAPVACVDAEVRFSRLRGTTFEDRDEDGVFNVGPDLAFVGMRVAAYEATDPDGPAVLEATTDDAGRFLLDRLRPGRYRLRVFSSADVLLKTFDDVELAPDVDLQRDLLIDPSGRVYDSVEGDLIDGAEVFIYRDVDLDDFDPLDDESQAGKVLVPPEDLEAASQQGQRTAHGGLYQFAVRRPGRYFIEVVPPGPSYVAPSVLVPPTPGPAFTEDQARRVVPEDLPSVEPDADRTYFLAFDLRGPDDAFFNNHVPIDPLSSLIDLQKRAARSTATVGAIVTYEVDVVNRSPLDLVFDPATGTGGVIIEDVLPKGFKYIAGSAVRVRVGEGREVPLGADDPTGVRILRFGSVREEAGRRVLRPMDLAAGEAIRLRYQAVVGANVKPKRTYTNRATLLADGNVPISRPATADVLVVADPDFDQGLVLGKVFCDADGDGRQGEGEAGTPGVRIFMDTGYFAVTDSAGQYHFKDIDPGTHAIKLDADTLLPGAEVTTDELRIVSFTRGLPAKVDFGVTCPAETVEGASLELGRDGVKGALDALRDRYLTVWGDADTLQLATRQHAVEAPLVAVKLLADGRDADGVDLPARAGGTSAELVFLTRTGPGAPSDRWALWVGPTGGAEALVAAGDGAPPARLVWNQKDAAGEAVLSSGRIYTYRLEVAGPAGALVGSPAGVFGVGATGPDEPALVASMPADGFDDRGRPGRAQKKAIGEVASALKALEGTLRVEVHSDDALSEEKAKARDQQRAEALKAYIVETVGLPAERVEAVGVGPLRPLAPNLSSFNRARNRRVELRHVAPAPAEGGAKAATIDAEPGFVPVVRAGTDEAAPAEDGSFALTTPVPEDGVVEVMVRAADGRRAVFPLTVKKGGAPAYGKPRELVVEGKLPGELTVGGVKVTPPALNVEATGPERVALADGKPGEPIEFALKAPKDTVAWRFAVVAQDGTPAFAVDQAGAPPATLKWDTGGTPLRAGRYRYQLTVRTGAPAVAQSAVGQLLLGELTAAGAGPERPGKPGLRVDGQSVALDENGGFYLPVTLRGDEAVLIEIQRADGGRSVFFVQAPPTGDAPPRARPTCRPRPPRALVGGGGGASSARRTRRARATPSCPGPTIRASRCPRRPPTPACAARSTTPRAPRWPTSAATRCCAS